MAILADHSGNDPYKIFHLQDFSRFTVYYMGLLHYIPNDRTVCDDIHVSSRAKRGDLLLNGIALFHSQ